MTIGTWGVVGGGQAAEGVKMGRGRARIRQREKAKWAAGRGGGGAQEALGVRKEKG